VNEEFRVGSDCWLRVVLQVVENVADKVVAVVLVAELTVVVVESLHKTETVPSLTHHASSLVIQRVLQDLPILEKGFAVLQSVVFVVVL